jgi:hypothetical protein
VLHARVGELVTEPQTGLPGAGDDNLAGGHRADASSG